MEKKYLVRGEKGYQVSLEKIWGSQPNESASAIYIHIDYLQRTKEYLHACSFEKQNF